MVAVAGLLATPWGAGIGRARTPLPRWPLLRKRIGDRLIKVTSPLDALAKTNGADSAALLAKLKNPYYLGAEPGLTQTLGWIDAWTSRPSKYAVVAESAGDVAAAVDFARTETVPLVVKGGGHSYFGNSNAADSLLVWTSKMRRIDLHDDFVGLGSGPNAAPVSAVSIGAGAIWGEVYHAVSVKAGRYVQGGGCLTVGVAGLVLGGGFGSFSKRFGTGAANLLEAEVVTADGKVRIVNEITDPDLLFALKGGGGGTFGVVTRVTLRTHELPQTFGAVLFKVKATSDAAWRALVARIVAFYGTDLFNSHWGEQLRFEPGRELGVSMLSLGLDRDRIEQIWAPLLAWIKARPTDYQFESEPLVLAIPARNFWDPAFLKALPGIVMADDRPGASPDNVFWTGNRDEAGQVLHAYQSAWMPAALLASERQASLVDALVAASAEWTVTLHTNKGLAGGDARAIEATRATATNPAVLGAFALLICAAEGDPAWPGIAGHEPDVAAGRRDAAGVARAMAPIRKLVPDAGAYMSEADYFDANWKHAYWGANYPRLAAIKALHDPDSLFTGHHCVEA